MTPRPIPRGARIKSCKCTIPLSGILIIIPSRCPGAPVATLYCQNATRIPAHKRCGRAPRSNASLVPNARVQLSGQADHSGECQRLVCRVRTGRDHRFSVARSAAHLGKLARPKRHAYGYSEGTGGLGGLAHGATLCAFKPRASGGVCGEPLPSETRPQN